MKVRDYDPDYERLVESFLAAGGTDLTDLIMSCPQCGRRFYGSYCRACTALMNFGAVAYSSEDTGVMDNMLRRSDLSIFMRSVKKIDDLPESQQADLMTISVNRIYSALSWFPSLWRKHESKEGQETV